MNKSNQNASKNSLLTVSNLLLAVSVVLQFIIFQKLSSQEATIGNRLTSHLRESRQAISKLISSTEAKFSLLTSGLKEPNTALSMKGDKEGEKVTSADIEDAYQRGKAEGY